MTDLPAPITRDQSFLAAIVDRLDRQNTLLADLRDRLPAASPTAGEGGAGAGPVELTEPARPGPAPPPEPAPPRPGPPAARKPAPRKTTAKTRRPTRKEES